MDASLLAKKKELEEENRCLKKTYADELGANKKRTQKLSVKWFIFNLKGSVQVIQSGQVTYCEHLSGPSKRC